MAPVATRLLIGTGVSSANCEKKTAKSAGKTKKKKRYQKKPPDRAVRRKIENRTASKNIEALKENVREKGKVVHPYVTIDETTLKRKNLWDNTIVVEKHKFENGVLVYAAKPIYNGSNIDIDLDVTDDNDNVLVYLSRLKVNKIMLLSHLSDVMTKECIGKKNVMSLSMSVDRRGRNDIYAVLMAGCYKEPTTKPLPKSFTSEIEAQTDNMKGNGTAHHGCYGRYLGFGSTPVSNKIGKNKCSLNRFAGTNGNENKHDVLLALVREAGDQLEEAFPGILCGSLVPKTLGKIGEEDEAFSELINPGEGDNSGNVQNYYCVEATTTKYHNEPDCSYTKSMALLMEKDSDTSYGEYAFQFCWNLATNSHIDLVLEEGTRLSVNFPFFVQLNCSGSPLFFLGMSFCR